MLDFEEELEKYHPSLEVEQVEDEIRNNEFVDVTDILRDVITELKGTR